MHYQPAFGDVHGELRRRSLWARFEPEPGRAERRLGRLPMTLPGPLNQRRSAVIDE